MKIRYALSKLSTLAHRLNVEQSELFITTGAGPENQEQHRMLETADDIISLTESIWGYMQDDFDLLEKLEADRLEQLREHTADLRNVNNMQDRYKKRIKLLTNKLKRVSETQTSK
tara:strand:- start:306 stop:650 length:345 start_codon:yes stop_codon:yes gene_type:complete